MEIGRVAGTNAPKSYLYYPISANDHPQSLADFTRIPRIDITSTAQDPQTHLTVPAVVDRERIGWNDSSFVLTMNMWTLTQPNADADLTFQKLDHVQII